MKDYANTFNCSLVERSFWIDPLGNTFICAMYRDEPQLNIIDCDIDSVFDAHQNIIHAKNIRPGECSSCGFLEKCNFACNASLRKARMDSRDEFAYICDSVRSLQEQSRRAI
jgi:radical SAM protein with 4Fe4S-binding SPASM domain